MRVRPRHRIDPGGRTSSRAGVRGVILMGQDEDVACEISGSLRLIDGDLRSQSDAV